MDYMKYIRLRLYRTYFKTFRKSKWDAQRDYLVPFRNIMRCNTDKTRRYSRLNKLRKKVFLNTVTIIQNGYYYVEDTPIKIDSDKTHAQSVFYNEKFDVSNLQNCDNQTNIEVVNSDCLDEGMRLLDLGYNPAILNMANRHFPGGGTTNGSVGQEEDIFRRTNIFKSLYQYASIGKSLKIEMSRHQYPMDRNYGGIYSPDVTIFRKNAQNGYALMEKPQTIAFISVAGINRPTLTSEGMIDEAHIEMIKNKIRTILRIGLRNGHDSLVLGALGCGAFRNPPQHIALLYNEVLNEKEFFYKYVHISFAIIEDSNSFHMHNTLGNLKCFEQQFSNDK